MLLETISSFPALQAHRVITITGTVKNPALAILELRPFRGSRQIWSNSGKVAQLNEARSSSGSITIRNVH